MIQYCLDVETGKFCLFDFFFFFNDTATTEIYTLSLHDALPIFPSSAAPSSLIDYRIYRTSLQEKLRIVSGPIKSN